MYVGAITKMGAKVQSQYCYRNIEKTRAKVVHKNLRQGCNLIKRFENFPKSRDMKVASCDL